MICMKNLSDKRIMVVVAHPDDEILGLGATMNRLTKENATETKVVILGEGLTSRSEQRELEKWKNQLKKHKANIQAAKEIIGYNTVKTYDFPDNRFDDVPLLDIIKVVEKEKVNFKPHIIFTHHGGDLNIDHRITFQSVITAARPLENESVESIITFPTSSGTEWQASTEPHRFVPNFFIEVSKENIDNKIAAMESYEFEKREYPHPRSPESLIAMARNYGSSVGTIYAEAFCVVRNLFRI